MANNNTMTDEFKADKKQRVRLLQRYLRTIAIEDTRIPMVSIDGLFYQETANSVSAFQRVNDLPETGEVDEETWNAIYSQYLEITRFHQPCSKVNIFSNPDAPLTQGSQGYTIYFAQVMLSRISEKYYNINKVDINGTVDAKTSTALQQIRTVSGLDEFSASDKDTLQAISTIYTSVIQK